ncbi:MAG: hypothetical protein H7A50_07890 [Akkermansiaceae bacterium]|nr:hypothetical protein [Akkermansiaceae bacterium]
MRSLLVLWLALGWECVVSGAESPPLMRDFIGLNGHTVQFKPELYQPLCSQVRDYHPVDWDLAGDTSEPAPFPFARNKVNWESVYGSWRKHGWNIDACLMFESVPREKWKNPDADARAYGETFAREFGPSGYRKLVGTVEVGNEPGSWSDADYTTMFRAMAEGIRKGDPALQIATCNLTIGWQNPTPSLSVVVSSRRGASSPCFAIWAEHSVIKEPRHPFLGGIDRPVPWPCRILARDTFEHHLDVEVPVAFVSGGQNPGQRVFGRLVVIAAHHLFEF